MPVKKKRSWGKKLMIAGRLRPVLYSLSEATGHNDGPAVEKYLRYTGLGKGYSWCAAFVCWVLGQAGVENPKTAWAASLFPEDKLLWKQGKIHLAGTLASNLETASRNVPKTSLQFAVMHYRNVRARVHTTHNSQLATMAKASIFGLYFPSLGRIGHCGFIDQWGEKEVITVEGNTNMAGSSDGDGVYRKRRPVKSIYAVADWIAERSATCLR